MQHINLEIKTNADDLALLFKNLHDELFGHMTNRKSLNEYTFDNRYIRRYRKDKKKNSCHLFDMYLDTGVFLSLNLPIRIASNTRNFSTSKRYNLTFETSI